MRPLFVALEGLSCTGKTTVVDEVAAATGALRLPTIPDEYTGLRRRFDHADQLDARFLCFLSAICLTSLEIQQQLKAGRSVVVESYLARTIAYHRGMGSSLDVELPGLRHPDVSFHLIGRRAVRERWRQQRGGTRGLWDDLAARHETAILCEYRRFPMHVIDTSTRTPHQVVEALLTHPLDGSCHCEDAEPLAGHQDLLSALPR